MDANHLAGTTPVPTWMVRLAMWVVIVLGGGFVASSVSVANWVFMLHQTQREHEARIAAIEVKNQNFIDAFNSVRKEFHEVRADINEIKMSLNAIKTRMP